MKKSLLSLVSVILASTLVCGSVNALEFSDLFSDWAPIVDWAHKRLLNEYDSTRWYSSNTSAISCEVNNGVTITSPIIEDATMDIANVYNLFISPYRMDKIKDWDPSVDTSKIIMKKVELNGSSENVKFEIPASDVDKNTSYYAFISPADMFDTIWTPSKEICFRISSNMCLQDTACDGLNSIVSSNEKEDVIEQHGASCVWMDLANVTHIVNWNTITLKWTAVEGNEVQIAIFDPEAEVYRSLWTAKMWDEKFDYKMEWDWEQNFMLTNWCKELYYKADAKRSEEEKKPEKEIVTPATGPAQNILYIVIAAIVLYGGYVVFFRKANND